MTDNKNYLFSYIDELDDDEIINFRNELISDIEYLKETKNNYQLEFEFIRLKYVEDLINQRQIDEMRLKLSM